jgi:CRP-like cAMP-binding protein
MESVLSGKPPPLRNFELAKDLSKDAITLIEGLLQTDPQKRWTADQVLENPWVQGITAKSQKIPLSDKRLAAYRRHKTKVGSAFFKLLLSSTDRLHSSPNSCNSKPNTSRSSLFETAFHRLDPENRGYVSTGELDRECSQEDEDVRLSLDDISSLLSEHMKNRYFPKGHILHREGDSGDAMYLIDSGKIECSTQDGLSKIRLPGDIFGLEVLNCDPGGHSKRGSQTYDSTAKCLTPVHVIEISRELYDKYVASDVESFLSMAEHQRHHKRERASALLRLHCSDNKTKYAKGETLFRAGEEGSDLVILESGEIDVLVNGNLVVRKLQQPGEMAGEHGAFLGKPYNASAKCTSENGCLVRTLPASAMHRAFVEDPTLRMDFRDLMLRRDFKKALCAKIQRAFPTSEEEIRAAFDVLDADRSGEISLDELRTVVKRFDPSYSEEDIHDMLESLDLNHSGTLTWVEFLRIFSMDKET